MHYFFGFSLWKHAFLKPFFDFEPKFINLLVQKNHLKKALQNGLNPQSTIYIWGKKSFPELEQYALDNQMNIYRVEDGFIRSVGLGSDLTQPYSLVVDSRGIYFDPSCTSDLEDILQHHLFSEDEISRGKKIRHYLVEKKLSKYNFYDNVDLDLPKDRTIIVVPGQVEDDASIRFGANGMSNLDLLRKVRENRPDGFIIYKPHPDVLVGNRVGGVEEGKALYYCDQIVTEVGIDSVLRHADEVHTMTSLVGFEALMRGIRVVTYGIPFYAGWGLSKDEHECRRRSRKLTIDELVAGVYLLYPRYIHPLSKKRCEIEEVLEILQKQRHRIRTSLWVQCRNWISRKIQMLIRILKRLS